MTASIMVFDHPFFRIPAADGAFTLDDVPAGNYQISAWHERIGESTQHIRVEPGRTARVEFALPMDRPMITRLFGPPRLVVRTSVAMFAVVAIVLTACCC